jgi:hypothetical protein
MPPSYAGPTLPTEPLQDAIVAKMAAVSVACMHEIGDRFLLQPDIAGGCVVATGRKGGACTGVSPTRTAAISRTRIKPSVAA